MKGRVRGHADGCWLKITGWGLGSDLVSVGFQVEEPKTQKLGLLEKQIRCKNSAISHRRSQNVGRRGDRGFSGVPLWMDLDGWKTSGIGKCKGHFAYSDYQLCIFQKENNHLDYRGLSEEQSHTDFLRNYNDLMDHRFEIKTTYKADIEALCKNPV